MNPKEPNQTKRGPGGKRPGAGRKKKEKPPVPEQVSRNWAEELIAALNREADDKESDEIKGWRRFWEARSDRDAWDCRKWLYEQSKGKPVQTVNHVHDKPIEVNHTHTLVEVIQKARLRAGK